MTILTSTPSETQEGNNSNWVSRMYKQVTSKKMWEMTETASCLNSHPKFLCNVGASIFSLQAQYFRHTFLWSRIFWRAVPPCLENVWQSFYFVSCCPIRTAYCQQLRQGHFFLPNDLLFATKKANSVWSFFDAHSLLWSWMVVPGAYMSHCHKK